MTNRDQGDAEEATTAGTSSILRPSPACRIWRVVGPSGLGTWLVGPLTKAVGSAASPDRHPRWSKALQGDASDTLRAARITLRLCGPVHPATDVALSAVLALALCGDGTACAVLALALRHASGASIRSLHLGRFATAWEAVAATRREPR